jgi:hypothetical protein
MNQFHINLNGEYEARIVGTYSPTDPLTSITITLLTIEGNPVDLASFPQVSPRQWALITGALKRRLDRPKSILTCVVEKSS